MTLLAESLDLPCGVRLKNRLAKTGMSEGLADTYHRATERHDRLYRRWAEGGAGLLITGNVMVDRRHLERPGNIVIEDRQGLRQLSRWVQSVTGLNAQIWMQISHPGRLAPKYTTPHPVSASDQPANGSARSRALGVAEIEDVIERFNFVARIAVEAGFGGVQIQAADGFLVQQFLSATVNKRTDSHGGSLENRARLLRDIARSVRGTVGPRFPISVKLDGSGNRAELQRLVQWLAEDGIDLLEIAGGTADLGTLRAQVPLMASSGIVACADAEAVLNGGGADLIGFGRPLCVAPDLPARLLAGDACDIPAFEKTLRLGPGIFGPSSPILFFKSMNEQGQLGWFSNQLIRMADGLDPDLDQGLYQALRRHQALELEAARAIRQPLS